MVDKLTAPRSLGAGQRHRNADEPRLAGILPAVAVGVVPDEVADRRGGQFAEVVVDAGGVRPGGNDDGRDRFCVARVAAIGAGAAERRARCVVAVEEAGRLIHLRDRVPSRPLGRNPSNR